MNLDITRKLWKELPSKFFKGAINKLLMGVWLMFIFASLLGSSRSNLDNTETLCFYILHYCLYSKYIEPE